MTPTLPDPDGPDILCMEDELELAVEKNDGRSLVSAAPDPDRRPAILVVDDDTAIRMLAKILLEASGYRVILATDGADALAAYRIARNTIKAVLTDVTMPLMTGPELIRAIRASDPEMPFVVMSGLEGPPSLPTDGGRIVFLTKPMTKRELLAAMAKALRVSVRDSPHEAN